MREECWTDRIEKRSKNPDQYLFPFSKSPSAFFSCQAKVLDAQRDPTVIADVKLRGDFNSAELATAVKVALACLDYDPLARPSMGQVVRMLSGEMAAVNGSFANQNRVTVVHVPHSSRLMGGMTQPRI